MLLTSKYKPLSVEDFIGQSHVTQMLRESSVTDDLPHLLFYGPPGTGKSCLIRALCRAIFGDWSKQRTLELNSCDDRGIQIVRDKIKAFAQVSVTNVPGVPNLRVVILDEADSMTADAQTALRRTMERFSKRTRFCLICNHVSRIIGPLASRCAKFRFDRVPAPLIHQRLQSIVKQEQYESMSDAVLGAIATHCQGDLRRALLWLQGMWGLHRDATKPSMVAELAGQVPEHTLEPLINAICKQDVSLIRKQNDALHAEGFDPHHILMSLANAILNMEHNKDLEVTSTFTDALAVADQRIADGASGRIQLLDVCIKAMELLCQ